MAKSEPRDSSHSRTPTPAKSRSVSRSKSRSPVERREVEERERTRDKERERAKSRDKDRLRERERDRSLLNTSSPPPRRSSERNGGGGEVKAEPRERRSRRDRYEDAPVPAPGGDEEFSSYYRDRFGSRSPEEYQNLRLSQFRNELTADEVKKLVVNRFSPKFGDLEVKVVSNPDQKADRLAYVNFTKRGVARRVRKDYMHVLQDMLGSRVKADPAGVIRDQDGRLLGPPLGAAATAMPGATGRGGRRLPATAMMPIDPRYYAAAPGAVPITRYDPRYAPRQPSAVMYRGAPAMRGDPRSATRRPRGAAVAGGVPSLPVAVAYDPDSDKFGRNERRSQWADEAGETLEPRMREAYEPSACRTLFVGNLPLDVTDRELRRLMARYGKVDTIDIKTPPNADGCYCFLSFKNLDQALIAKYYEHDKVPRPGWHQRMNIGFAKPTKSNRLWIGGLGNWTIIENLTREFDRYGLIECVDYDKSSDHAYVTFRDLEAATDACYAMRGFPLGGKDRRIRVDFASERLSTPIGGMRGSTMPHRRRAPREGSLSPRSRSHSASDDDADRSSPRRKRRRSERSDSEASGVTRSSGEDSPSGAGRSGRRVESIEEIFARAIRKAVAATPKELATVLQPCWTGALVLKKCNYAVQCYRFKGTVATIDQRLREPDGEPVKLHVTQRLPLATANLVERFGQDANEQVAILLAVPNPAVNDMDEAKMINSAYRPIKALIHYLREKCAAGVVTLDEGASVYLLPPCDLSKDLLKPLAPGVTLLDQQVDNVLLMVLVKPKPPGAAGKAPALL